MNKKIIFAIGRQFGSGGRAIGRILSQRLGIPFYDKDILTQAAKQSGLSGEVMSYFDEAPNNSLLYSLSTGVYSMGDIGVANYTLPVNQQVFQAQFDAIRALAEEGPCVIVGRCADYVLEKYPFLVSAFIYADLPKRMERVAEYDEVTLAEAKSRIAKSDKKRANYYNFYSGKKWGMAATYDLCINSTII
ncbi:MAG: cytidylate kinase-like family protein, partial [Clostridia bacterium]|nr:cytidylate kinase-like family protein [Clostridia bacterium]